MNDRTFPLLLIACLLWLYISPVFRDPVHYVTALGLFCTFFAYLVSQEDRR